MNRLDYEKQLDDVSAYIYDHLQDDLDLDRLADIACLSSFSRAFREVFGMPPATYRSSGNHVLYRVPGPNESLPDHPVEIRLLDPILLLSVPHSGSFMIIGHAFTRVFDAIAESPELSNPLPMIAIYYSESGSVPERLLHSRAGIVADNDTIDHEKLQRVTIPGGRHAVLRFRGPYASMHAAYEWFFGAWLSRSGDVPGDQPVFEEYLNNPVDTDPMDLLTDIYMPLQG